MVNPTKHFPKLFMLTTVLLVAVDQLVKWHARTAADWTEGRVYNALIPGIFELKLSFNHGIAFGMFQGFGWVFAPVALLIAGWSYNFCSKLPTDFRLLPITFGALAAGAIGNLIDRLWMQKVTDMFWFRPINFPVFNIADSCITVAAIILVFKGLTEPQEKPQTSVKEVQRDESENSI